jgi:succinoglycan biosynthesis transport protein ExoP
MSLHQFLLILRARWRVALAVALGTVLLALLVSLLLPRTYTAQTSVLVDVRTPDPVMGAVAMQGLVAPSYMATQVDIIGGERVAQHVVKALKLDEDPDLRADWQKATEGRGSLVGWIAGTLQRGLDVHPARESNVINIVYRGRDPEQVARVADAFAQAYLDTSVALKTEPAKVYAQWFDDQAKTLRARLEEAQSRLSNYQQKAGLVSGDERLDHETTRLAELSAQLTQVQGQNTEVGSKRNARGDTVAEVMQSSVINGLKSDVSRLDAKVREAGAYLGPNHPQMQRMQAELAGLRAQLQAEVGRINSSIDTSWRVGQQRERELQGAVAAQKARVMMLNKQRDELNVYRRDVEAAQRAYEEVSKNANQSRLQSLTNQTNVVRLDSASAPLEPSSPRTKFNLLVAAFGGTLLGIGLALLLELANRRVRSAEDIAMALDVPVLARLSGRSSDERDGPDLLGGPPLALGHGV